MIDSKIKKKQNKTKITYQSTVVVGWKYQLDFLSRPCVSWVSPMFYFLFLPDIVIFAYGEASWFLKKKLSFRRITITWCVFVCLDFWSHAVDVDSSWLELVIFLPLLVVFVDFSMLVWYIVSSFTFVSLFFLSSIIRFSVLLEMCIWIFLIIIN